MKIRTLLIVAATLTGTASCSKSELAGKGSADGPIKVKASFDKFDGDYENAVYVKRKSGGATLAAARGCPSFGCDSVDAYGNANDAVKASCASAAFLVSDFPNRGDGKLGDNTVTIDVSLAHESGTVTGRDPVGKLKITDLGAGSVTGTVEYKSDHDTWAKGPFKAKVCEK